MITKIQSDRLVIISDLHLGNPFCKARNRTVEFLRWAQRAGYDVCINGDGFEIAQVSFQKIARDVPDVFHALKSFTENGRNLYYVVGNHDIALEHFLNDWGGFRVAPFLNVKSGSKRIRIEHGHLYDPFFIRSPDLYEFCTWFAGIFLNFYPSAYKLWIAFERMRSRFRKKGSEGIKGEHPNFLIAAAELSQRGFDTVIFGHTHHLGTVAINERKQYFNSGSWLLNSHFLEILNGEVHIKTWGPSLLVESPKNQPVTSELRAV